MGSVVVPHFLRGDCVAMVGDFVVCGCMRAKMGADTELRWGDTQCRNNNKRLKRERGI